MPATHTITIRTGITSALISSCSRGVQSWTMRSGGLSIRRCSHRRPPVVEPAFRTVDPKRLGHVYVRGLVYAPRGADRIESGRSRDVFLDCAVGPHAGRKALSLHTVEISAPTHTPCIAPLSPHRSLDGSTTCERHRPEHTPHLHPHRRVQARYTALAPGADSQLQTGNAQAGEGVPLSVHVTAESRRVVMAADVGPVVPAVAHRGCNAGRLCAQSAEAPTRTTSARQRQCSPPAAIRKYPLRRFEPPRVFAAGPVGSPRRRVFRILWGSRVPAGSTSYG